MSTLLLLLLLLMLLHDDDDDDDNDDDDHQSINQTHSTEFRFVVLFSNHHSISILTVILVMLPLLR